MTLCGVRRGLPALSNGLLSGVQERIKAGHTMMNIISKLLGRDDKFFDLLEAGAVKAQGSVQLLAELLRDSPRRPTVDDFIQARSEDTRIAEELAEELCKTFVTPLEREDIEALSLALSEIPKLAEKFSEKFMLGRDALGAAPFSRQLGLLEQAAEASVQMVRELRERKHLSTVKEQNTRLHGLKGESDLRVHEQIRELQSGHDPLKGVLAMDLHDTLEKIMDRYSDAGNVVFRIVLKYT
jgi:uncharacterized protein Yka (UPF0111/DUF47 family)